MACRGSAVRVRLAPSSKPRPGLGFLMLWCTSRRGSDAPGAPRYPHLVHDLVHACTSAERLQNRAASATPPTWCTSGPWDQSAVRRQLGNAPAYVVDTGQAGEAAAITAQSDRHGGGGPLPRCRGRVCTKAGALQALAVAEGPHPWPVPVLIATRLCVEGPLLQRHRWVVLHGHKKALDLLWAGGGLNQCRDEHAYRLRIEASTSSHVPATREALLRLIPTLEESKVEPILISKAKRPKELNEEELPPDRGQAAFPWRVIALNSTFWLTVLVLLGLPLTSQIQRQDQRLEQLIKLIDTK